MSSPPSTPGVVEELVRTIAHAHAEAETTRYIAVAACTLFLYDLITTIDYEVQYIWSSRWFIPRVVFHLNRLWPIVVLGVAVPVMFIPSVSPTTCKNVVLVYSYASVMTSLNIAAVVILRCWALYDRKLWVLRFLLFGVTLAAVACIVVLKNQADANQYPVNTLPELLPGYIIIYTPNSWMPYLSALVFETVVFSMMLYKTYLIARDYGSTPLIQRLLIDGTLYYVAAIIAVIFCLGAATNDRLRAPVISAGLLVSILSVMCSRMILSLYNFTEQERLERVAALGTAGSSTVPTRFNANQRTTSSGLSEVTGWRTGRDERLSGSGESIHMCTLASTRTDVSSRQHLEEGNNTV